MKRAIIIFLLAVNLRPVSSQEYAVSSIPEDLSYRADAVTRYHSGAFEVLSIDKAKFNYKRVITIFNSDGNHHALMAVFYDDLRKINSLEAYKYDEKGKEIEKVRKSNFRDESAVGGNFFDDSRVLWYDLRQENFPYTVTIEYEVSYKFLYSIPDWQFIDAYDESCEFSTFTLSSPSDLKPRFLTQRANPPTISEEIDQFSATWTEKNLEAIDYEPNSPTLGDIAPRILLSPGKFEFEGYRGDMSTWDGIAKWQHSLNEGRDELPESTISAINELTEGLSDYEKTKAVYEYMQSKTRYVSLQLGIGGFQPFPAKFVDEEGYGDCKALSFYTQTLLEKVGVQSHYTWVHAGNNPPKVIYDFPNDNFNHIILCVPNNGDTLWLECTSQIMPFGFLGDFTNDRDVFVVHENGGKIVRTPTYGLEQNKQRISTSVALTEQGNAEVSGKISYTGLKYDDILGVINSGFENQKKWLERNIRISSFEIDQFEFKEEKKALPEATLTANLQVRKLVSKSGTRFFLQPNLMNRNTYIPNKDDNRKNPIKIDYPYQETDSIYYSLPEGYQIETFFKPIEIASQFGEYRAEISRTEDGQILYARSFTQFQGEFEPSSYEAFTDFHKKIVRADKKRVSFKKKT